MRLIFDIDLHVRFPSTRLHPGALGTRKKSAIADVSSSSDYTSIENVYFSHPVLTGRDLSQSYPNETVYFE